MGGSVRFDGFTLTAAEAKALRSALALWENFLEDEALPNWRAEMRALHSLEDKLVAAGGNRRAYRSTALS